MSNYSRQVLLMFYVIVCLVLSGCVTYFSLSPKLDEAVGKQTSDITYPELKYHNLISEDGSKSIIQYSIDSLWRCRWIFEVRKKDNVVTSWWYPDAESAAWCKKLPTSRP